MVFGREKKIKVTWNYGTDELTGLPVYMSKVNGTSIKVYDRSDRHDLMTLIFIGEDDTRKQINLYSDGSMNSFFQKGVHRVSLGSDPIQEYIKYLRSLPKEILKKLGSFYKEYWKKLPPNMRKETERIS